MLSATKLLSLVKSLVAVGLLVVFGNAPTYTASEVGALPNTTSIPTATSNLTNDSNFVADSTYVHTDNNFTSVLKSSYDNAVTNSHSHSNKSVLDNTTASYTTEEKNKLSGLNNYTLPTASTTVRAVSR